jgi:hypothetical protein
VVLSCGLALAGRPVYGATPVFVDGTGVCGGNAPCFTTIQAGVNNAGPAPAVVNVFPGTYAESVDLGLMGSAIAGAPGAITIRTVSTAGTPTPGTAMVVPASGPGFWSSVSPYPGDVELDGFTVRSPDDDGINPATVMGNVTLRNIVSDGNASDGFSAGISGGNVEIYDSSFSDNMDNGISFGTATDVIFDRVIADRNNGSGASFGLANGVVRVTRSRFSGNTDGSGLSFGTAAEVTFERVTADGNSDFGASFGIANGVVRAVDSSFDDNTDGSGLSFGTATEVTFERVTADRNDGSGASFGIANGVVHASDSSFTGNTDGSGLSFSTAVEVVFLNVTADGNNGSGASFGLNDGVVRAASSSFSGNTDGSGLSFATCRRFDALRLTVSNNSEGGLSVGAVAANVSASRFEGNSQAGIGLSVLPGDGEIVLTCNDIAGNGDGLTVAGAAGDVQAPRNFWGDPSGPTHPSNPGGSGDTIQDGANGGAGNVVFVPFLSVSASQAESCATKGVPALDARALAALVLALLFFPARRLARRERRSSPTDDVTVG